MPVSGADPATTPTRAASPHAGRALVGLVVANICLACGPWLVRLADVGALSSAFWRLALALPVLLALIGATGGRAALALPRALWPALLLAGLAFAADLAAWHMGIHRTRLANSTLFGNGGSFFFAIYGFVVARRLPGASQGVALALAAAGVALLLGRSFELSPKNLTGDLLCLTAGVFYAVYLIAMDRARGVLAPLPALLAVSAVAAVAILPVALLREPALMPRDWTPLLLLALGSQVIGQGLLIYAMGHLPPIVVGLGLLSQPVVAAAIGWIAYGERLTITDMIGAAAIAAALVLVRRSPRASGRSASG